MLYNLRYKKPGLIIEEEFNEKHNFSIIIIF